MLLSDDVGCSCSLRRAHDRGYPSQRRRPLTTRGRGRQNGSNHSGYRSCRSTSLPPTDLLCYVICRSFTLVGTDARRRRKNAKALRLSIKESERIAQQRVASEAKAQRLAKEQARAAQCLAWLCSSSPSNDGDTTTDDDDAPPAAGTYTAEFYRRSEDRKGKGPARKW